MIVRGSLKARQLRTVERTQYTIPAVAVYSTTQFIMTKIILDGFSPSMKKKIEKRAFKEVEPLAHTAGPWKAKKEKDCYQIFALSSNHVNSGIRLVSSVYDPDDAMLISAAPDLLAACKQALDDGDDYAAMQSIKAAIAKAEGK